MQGTSRGHQIRIDIYLCTHYIVDWNKVISSVYRPTVRRPGVDVSLSDQLERSMLNDHVCHRAQAYNSMTSRNATLDSCFIQAGVRRNTSIHRGSGGSPIS